MIDSVNCVKQYNYNTTVPAVKANLPMTAQSSVSIPVKSRGNLRTELSSSDEIKKYTELLSISDRNTKKQLEMLLKSGILLNNNSNDHSTVLENLYKIAKTPRAEGLSATGLLKDVVSTLFYPHVITQQFGDIPDNYRLKAIRANVGTESNLIKQYVLANDVDVEHSGVCVAASIEFNLAQKLPAEFARFAEGLSSPKMSVSKNIQLKNLADNTLDAIWLLNAFEIPYETDNFNNAKLTFAPDKNALIRAQIQTNYRDPLERSPLDVLMQSTFMQVGSQQAYNSLTDRRGGKFNVNDKGLIEFEKTFTESVVSDKNILSVTYQTLDDNGRLIGYETDLATTKKHLLTALDMGENVIIGYTQVDQNNIVINGHEITIMGYKYAPDGKLVFICNDTDDDVSRPIEYTEDYLLPKIHHAALPQCVVANDLNVTPNWVEGLNIYKERRAA